MRVTTALCLSAIVLLPAVPAVARELTRSEIRAIARQEARDQVRRQRYGADPYASPLQVGPNSVPAPPPVRSTGGTMVVPNR